MTEPPASRGSVPTTSASIGKTVRQAFGINGDIRMHAEHEMAPAENMPPAGGHFIEDQDRARFDWRSPALCEGSRRQVR